MNLEINKGEFILFCGGSGSGKATITRLLNGIIPHYYDGELSENITINGKEYKDMSLFDISKKVGSVFQNPRSQFFNVDTTSEIAFAPENHGWDKEDILARVDEVAEKLNMENLMHRNIFAFSGYSNELAESGKTVIIVTHDPEFILRCCDDVIHIEDGKVLDNYCLSGNIGQEKLLFFFKDNYRI